MRTRNNEIKVRFTDKELAALDVKVAKTHLSRESFIRSALAEEDIYVRPDPITWELLMQIRRIGTNLNQLVFLAHSREFIDGPAVKKVTEELWRCLPIIQDAYVIKKEGKEESD